MDTRVCRSVGTAYYASRIAHVCGASSHSQFHNRCVCLQPTDPHDLTAIGDLLQAWALATRQNRSDDILRHHAVDVVIFDVLAPMQYTSASEYRASWAEWQPDTEGEAIFDLEDLVIRAGSETAFAHAFIRCGGAMPDGRAFTDHVRATFCLTKSDGHWVVVH